MKTRTIQVTATIDEIGDNINGLCDIVGGGLYDRKHYGFSAKYSPTLNRFVGRLYVTPRYPVADIKAAMMAAIAFEPRNYFLPSEK